MALRITRVYTKTGDDGQTGLAGGQRVAKNHPRIEAYGTVDELMSVLGWVRQEAIGEAERFSDINDAARLDALLEFIGNKLFTLGGELATRPEDRHPQMQIIGEADIEFLERVCDRHNESLAPLTDFVLPGGTRTAAAMHVARTVTRRAERAIVLLSESEEIGLAARYINRMSDALFVLARWVNAAMSAEETIWRKDLAEPKL